MSAEHWMQLPYVALLGVTGCTITAFILLYFLLVFNPFNVSIIGSLLGAEFVLLSYGYRKLIFSIQQGREKLHFLQAINAQLEESHHFKNQLLLVINHEIRAPLSAVKGFTVLLQTYGHELDEGTKARYLEQIERACDETAAIVESLVTSIQQDEQTTILHSVNLEEQLQAVLDSLAPRIQEEQRQMELHTEPVRVLAHPLKLRQVVRNLIVNAMNYSPAGTPVQIAITLQHPGMPQRQERAEASRVFISIRDQGIGISPEDQEHLFQPSLRLEAGKTMAPEGSGLGLFLCKTMLATMDGEVWIESANCEGYRTTVWISLQMT